jgi:hypothetical protein
MRAESLNMLKTAALWILKKDLGKRELCARFVPHSLSPEKMENQVIPCQDIVVMVNANNFF